MAIRTSFPPALPLYGWPSAGPESCGVSWRPLFGLRRCVPRGSGRGFRHAVIQMLGAMGTYEDATRIERGPTLRGQTAMPSRVTREGSIGLLQLPDTAGSRSALLPSSSTSGAEWCCRA